MWPGTWAQTPGGRRVFEQENKVTVSHGPLLCIFIGTVYKAVSIPRLYLTTWVYTAAWLPISPLFRVVHSTAAWALVSHGRSAHGLRKPASEGAALIQKRTSPQEQWGLTQLWYIQHRLTQGSQGDSMTWGGKSYSEIRVRQVALKS